MTKLRKKGRFGKQYINLIWLWQVVSGSESEVTQSCPTLCDPMDCSPPGSFHPWSFLSKSTGVGCHFLLQGNLPDPGYRLDVLYLHMGFPGGTSGKEPACQCRRHKRRGFDPWVGKQPLRRKQQLTPVFLPGESLGQRTLVVQLLRLCASPLGVIGSIPGWGTKIPHARQCDPINKYTLKPSNTQEPQVPEQDIPCKFSSNTGT